MRNLAAAPVRLGPEGEREAVVATVEHQSLPETVRKVLRRRMLNNELPAGARLVEASLAGEMGVSRATIRQAIRELAVEGLVEIIPRRQSVVTRMSADVAEDVCFARYVLEAGMARSLSPESRQQLDVALSEVLDEMDAAARAADLEAMVEADGRFHGLIVAASGRRRAGELWASIDAQMGALMRASIDRQQLALEGVRARHEPVRQAVVHGTSRQIEKALRTHYVNGPGVVVPDRTATG